MVHHVVVEDFESYDRRYRDNLILRAIWHLFIFLVVYAIVYIIGQIVGLSRNLILIITLGALIYIYFTKNTRKKKKRQNKKRRNKRRSRRR